jgi:hypothetical protein
MVKSEHNSPVLGPSQPVNPAIRELAIPAFDSKAYSYSPFGTDSPATQTNSYPNSQNASQQDLTLPERFPDTWFMTYEQAHDYEPPQWTDPLSVDWSTYNLEAGNNLLNPLNNTDGSSFLSQQQPSFPQFDLRNQINRAGIGSSSGEASEVESPPNGWINGKTVTSDLRNVPEPINDLGSHGADDVSDRYRLSSASSYFGTPQGNMLANDSTTPLDIDDYLKQAEAETKRMQMQSQMAQMQMAQQRPQHQSRMGSVQSLTPSVSTPGSTTTGEHPYTVREALGYAHLDRITPDHMFSPRPGGITTPMVVEDPSWSMAPDMSNPELALNDEQEDEDWVR